jgi:hypothetical protein
MDINFKVVSSEELPHGGFNTNLVVSISEDVDGNSYWIKTNKQLAAGKVIPINMDLLVVTTEQTKDKHDIRVLKPKSL